MSDDVADISNAFFKLEYVLLLGIASGLGDNGLTGLDFTSRAGDSGRFPVEITVDTLVGCFEFDSALPVKAS